MNTLTIVPLVIPALSMVMLISLIIKERGYLFKDVFKTVKQGDKQKKNSSDTKNNNNDGKGFVDFSGGVWGI